MDLARARSVMIDLSRRLRGSGLSVHAAAIAYNSFLALVPLAFAMVGVAGVIGRSASAVRRVDDALDPLVPETVKEFILELLLDAGQRVGGGSLWLVVVSIALALIFGARAVTTMQKSLALLEDRTERRPAVEMRIVAVGLTLAGGVAIVLTSAMLVLGRSFVAFFGDLSGMSFLDDIWIWVRVPVAAAGLFGFLVALYRFGPPEPLPRAWLAALVATGGAVLGSLGFGLYLAISPELGATIGVLGGVAVALVWLYLGAAAILLGALTAAQFTSD